MQLQLTNVSRHEARTCLAVLIGRVPYASTPQSLTRQLPSPGEQVQAGRFRLSPPSAEGGLRGMFVVLPNGSALLLVQETTTIGTTCVTSIPYNVLRYKLRCN